ncbi:MAG: sugar kinase [Vicinamibacteria bacterium]|jgi:2-dehydro-3-deoxygluconokinase|nr:sugar kinase [Vicinamibacteria bacterium]
MPHDVIGFGEALLRLVPTHEERVVEASTFHAYVGGAELNTCSALASLGLSAAWFSVLPSGLLGERVRRHLRACGVDPSLVRTTPGRLGTYWVEYGRAPRSIEVIYDRAGSTVCSVRPEDAPWDAVRASRAFFVSGITPALSPATRELALALCEAAREAGALVATDLNYRARLWSAVDAAPVLERLARAARVVIATADDARALWGIDGEPEKVARALQARFGCECLVLTRGAEGALAIDAGTVRQAEVMQTTRRDRIGAGDAFTAGVLGAWLTGHRERALDYGLAMAALKHTVPGDTLSTSLAEVEAVAAREVHDIRR